MTFLESLPPFGPERDAFLLRCIAGGRLDVPRWYRLTMGRVQIDVSRDYLTINGERTPMAAPVAQAAVDSLDALLPTPAIVDAIEEEPSAIVTWLPTQPPQGDRQLTAASFAQCERETWNVLQGHLGSDTALLAGHRKDVVVAPWMPVGRVVLYGARWKDGRRLQPLYPAQGSKKGHLLDWADYAQGIRAVRRRCWFDGKEALLDDVLAAGHCGGPVARKRYPVEAERNTPTVSATLRKGDHGPTVVELQTLLAVAGFPTRIDGIFGPDTDKQVRAFQKAHPPLVVDGLVGPRTMAALRSSGSERPPFDVSNAPTPLSDADRARLFGAFQWEPAPTAHEPGAIKILGTWVKDNFTTITVPQLVGVPGAPKGRVYCNRRAAPALLRFFAAVEKAGKKDRILTFDGCTNFRLVRGGSSPSNHAWGTDIDVNAQWNLRGSLGAPLGAKGSLVELYPIAVDCGLGLGLNWSTPDPMHLGVLAPEP